MLNKLSFVTLFFAVIVLMMIACKKDIPPTPIVEEPEIEEPIDEPEEPEVPEFASSAERPIDLNPEEWELDENLTDHFDAADVNTEIWNKDPNDWGPWSWEPDNAYQEEGSLNLRMRYEEHSARNMDMFYKMGMIRSLDTISYGYVEAKMKGIEVYPAASPAFWLYSLGYELDEWGLRDMEEGTVRYSEIDMVEMQQGNYNPETDDRFGVERTDHNLHMAIVENGETVRRWPGEFPEIQKLEYDAPFDPRNEFHTYGADITPEKITFYIDGYPIGEKANLYWHLPMHITLSLGLRYPHVTWNNCPNGLDRCPVPEAATEEGFPATAQVDWVRCYRRK